MEYASEQARRTLSPPEFAAEAGLLNPLYIRFVEQAETGIPYRIALAVSRRYPVFSPLWLMGRSQEKNAGPFAPLSGYWLKWNTFQLSPLSRPEDPDVWEESPIDQRAGVGIEFFEDGSYRDMAGPQAIGTGFYSFNEATGELVTGFDEQHIVERLTDTDLEIWDWRTFCRPMKFCYKRFDREKPNRKT